MNNPAIIISICALLFTVFSFWWMNWRRGKLHVTIPRSFAAIGAKDARMVLEFPFVFFNNGPMPIIVQNLRLLFIQEENPHPLNFTATVKKLGKDEDRALATQFPVRGREAILMICEFQREPGGMEFEERSYEIELQATLGNSRKWRRLSRFPMKITRRSLPAINKQFIAHDNLLED